MKHPTSFRLSDEALALLAALSDKLGVSQTAIIELAIRKFNEGNKEKAQ